MLDVMEPEKMNGNLSGGTTSLLRIARTQCHAAVAFVALAIDESMFATATYPVLSEDDLVAVSSLDDLVRQVWEDSELKHGDVLVRSVRAGNRRLAGAKRVDTALVLLDNGPDGRPWGILGVAGPEGGEFGPDVNELLALATRMSSYLRARQEVRHWVSRDADESGPVTLADVTSAQPTAQPQTPVAAAVPAVTLNPEPVAIAESQPVAEQAVPVAPVAPDLAPAPQAPEPAALPPVAAPVAADPAPQPTSAKPTTFELTPAADEPASTPEAHAAADPLAELLQGEDPITGLQPLSTLLGRTGRMLGSGFGTDGALVVVVLEIQPGDSEGVLRSAGRALQDRLRFDDPVARIGGGAFAAVVPLVAGITSADVVEQTLITAVEQALRATGADVQISSGHIVASLRERHDADVLLRHAVEQLRAG